MKQRSRAIVTALAFAVVAVGLAIAYRSITRSESRADVYPKARVSPDEAERTISDQATSVMMALKGKDLEALSRYVHPKEGLHFSPYPYVRLDKHQVFQPPALRALLEDSTQYVWGLHAGSGEPLKYTFAEYYDRFVYDVEFADAPVVAYNKIVSLGNTHNNIFEIYESPISVEYYFPGFEPRSEGVDWRSLWLVFEKHGGKWRLVAVVHGQWTP